MNATPCPDCDGDGATYEWARVGQHATPFVCLRCDGSGEVTDPDIPIEEVEVRALREALAREIARANALQDALDEEREGAAPTLAAQEPTDAEVEALARMTTEEVSGCDWASFGEDARNYHRDTARRRLTAARAARLDEKDKP